MNNHNFLNFFIACFCFLLTIILYIFNKILYRRHHRIWLIPSLFTPCLLIIFLIIFNISYAQYSIYTHWLVWMLGPATIAFAIPIYENLALIQKHWLSLSFGIFSSLLISVCSSVWLAKILLLPEEIQRSLAVHSATTPLAIEASRILGGNTELAALFAVLTGLIGIIIGEFLLMRLTIRSSIAKGTGFGSTSHGIGTAKAYELGMQEGVISSLAMVLAGVMTVICAPIIKYLMW